MSRWPTTVASLPYIYAYSSNKSPGNTRTQLDPAMENSSTPFTDLLNSSPSSNPSNSSPQTRQEIPHHIPGYPPPNIHMNLPPQHYGYQPHYPPNFMAFGGQGSYQQQTAGAQPSYHQLMSGMASGSYLGPPYQGNVGQYPQAFAGGGTLGGDEAQP
jgi:hypothetical protein